MSDFLTVLLTCSVTMSALAVVYMVLGPLLSRWYSERGRYYAWLILVIGLIPLRPQAGQVPMLLLDVLPPGVSSLATPGNGATVIPVSENAVATIPGIALWSIPGGIWLAGLIAFLIYHGVKHYRLMMTTARWSEPVSREAIALFDSIKGEMGISAKIGLLHCPSIGSPILTGLIRPRIFLPETDMPEDDLRLILRHELIHYKRKDLWYKCAVLAVTAVHWFNPIVYLMARQISALCESSCDAEIVADMDMDERRQYGAAIMGLMKRQAKLKTPLSTAFYGGETGMKKRLQTILDTKAKRMGALMLWVVLLCTVVNGSVLLVSKDRVETRPPVPLIYADEDIIKLQIIFGTGFPVVGVDVDWYINGEGSASLGTIYCNGTVMTNGDSECFELARQNVAISEEDDVMLVFTLTEPDYAGYAEHATEPLPMNVRYGETYAIRIMGDMDALTATLE